MKTIAFLLTPLLFAASLLALAGCATDTGDPAKDRRGRVTNAVLQDVGIAVGRAALSTLTNVASDEIAGNKVDFSHAASEGLWANAGSIVDASSVARVINAYGAGQIAPVAAAAAQQFTAAAPKTAADRKAVVGQIARSISTTAIRVAASLSAP